MIAPRHLQIRVGNHDEVFDFETTKNVLRQTEEYFEKLGQKDKLKITVFDGKHEFCKDDSAISDMIASLYE